MARIPMNSIGHPTVSQGIVHVSGSNLVYLSLEQVDVHAQIVDGESHVFRIAATPLMCLSVGHGHADTDVLAKHVYTDISSQIRLPDPSRRSYMRL